MSAPAIPLPRDELHALLRLRVLPGLGDVRLRALRERYGSFAAAVDAPAAALGEKPAAARSQRRYVERAARALATIERLGCTVFVHGAAGYPQRFLELRDPPMLICALGRLELLERVAVAVVGSRRHTHYGAQVAKTLAEELALAGVVVVSGMARGIDAIAHAAALDGGTIGVLGCGIDVVFPHENAELYRRVAREGLLLTEFAPGEPALPFHFPQRNRLIAALARAVVVVEASPKSGTLITTDHALDLGRDVFAVPGPIGSAASAGTNALIREGATLLTSTADVLHALGFGADAIPAVSPRRPREAPAGLGDAARALWDALGTEADHIDAIALRSGLTAPAAMAVLLELEVHGLVRQLPGMHFVHAR